MLKVGKRRDGVETKRPYHGGDDRIVVRVTAYYDLDQGSEWHGILSPPKVRLTTHVRRDYAIPPSRAVYDGNSHCARIRLATIILAQRTDKHSTFADASHPVGTLS